MCFPNSVNFRSFKYIEWNYSNVYMNVGTYNTVLLSTQTSGNCVIFSSDFRRFNVMTCAVHPTWRMGSREGAEFWASAPSKPARNAMRHDGSAEIACSVLRRWEKERFSNKQRPVTLYMHCKGVLDSFFFLKRNLTTLSWLRIELFGAWVATFPGILMIARH